MVLNPVHVDARKFFWHGNEGSQEISTLGRDFRFERVYDDACDVGLTIVDEREAITFVVVSEDRRDGEIMGWHLESINRKTGRQDGRFKVLIIND